MNLEFEPLRTMVSRSKLSENLWAHLSLLIEAVKGFLA